LCIAVAVPWCASSLAQPTTIEAIVHQNEAATVVIFGTKTLTRKAVQGSGVCVDTSGYVLTVAHQVMGVGDLRARLRDGSERDLTMVDVDQDAEIALLKTSKPMPVAARTGDASTLRSGSDLVAISTPMNLDFSTVTGIVSNPHRTLRGRPMLQVDLRASPGSSGGPVFDRQGNLIGLIVGVLEQQQWVTIVTPVNNALPMLERYGVSASATGYDADPVIIPAKDVTRDELQAIRAYNAGVAAAEPERKIASYREAVTLLPNFFEGWFNLAVAYTAAKDVENAVAAYRQTDALSLDDHRLLLVQRNLGRLFAGAARWKDAAACFERAAQLAPEDAGAFNDLGEASRHLDDLEKAEECFLVALELRPDYPAARYNLGLTYAATGNNAKAAEQLEQYLILAPDAGDAEQVREWIRQLEGDSGAEASDAR